MDDISEQKPTEQTPLKPEMGPKSLNLFLYSAAATSSLIAFLSGIAYSWTSPVIPKLDGTVDMDNNPLGRPTTSSENSWIVSIVSVGAMFSTIISGYLSNKIGRKKTLLVIACPLTISLIILALAQNIPLFYLGRFLMGLGAGGGFTIVPMYLTEIAEDHNRGTLGCLMAVFIGLGGLFTYTIGPMLSIMNFCLACLAPLAIFFPVFLIWMPESPQYSALIKDEKSLEASLLKLRKKTKTQVRKEVEEMMNVVQEKGTIKDLVQSKSSRKGLLITVLLILGQQFSGINVVLSYMQTIFSATGAGLAPETSTIIVGVIQLLVIVLASCIVDKLGRRILLLTSSIGSGLSLIALGTYFYLLDNGTDFTTISWLPISSILVFIISFNIGLSNIPWIVMVELFPSSAKAIGTICTGVVCFIACFLITLFFPAISLALGMSMSFWIFAVVCAFTTVFVYFMLPETKGKSLEEIQMLLAGQKVDLS